MLTYRVGVHVLLRYIGQLRSRIVACLGWLGALLGLGVITVIQHTRYRGSQCINVRYMEDIHFDTAFFMLLIFSALRLVARRPRYVARSENAGR